MSVRRAAGWLASIVCLSTAACKTPPAPADGNTGPAGATAEASPSSSAPTLATPRRTALEGAFQCTPEGKASIDSGGGVLGAQQLLTLEGDTSPEARTLVADGLCQRNAAFLACLAKEREEARFPARSTFKLSVADHAVKDVEGGTSELRTCLATAFVGSPAGAATSITLVYVPGPSDRPHPNVRVRDVKAPDGVPLEDVAAKLRTKNPVLRACYEMALREQSTLAGTILVEQDLGKGGKATKTRVKHGTLTHESFEKCVEQRLGTLAFDEPKGGKGTLRYTLVFAAR